MSLTRNKFSTLLIVSLSFGLAWAIRGSFGHEWGASWAGAMGSLALLVAVGKKDWLKNAPVLAALGAIGWAVGGMSSYGIVIGYCRSTDFLNVLYGFSMLFIIGGIYGYIGGGFLGLGLESAENKKIEWAPLIAQMVAGGMLSWGFLIYQMEWFMTPPRSELWAAAFGGCAALGWFLWRENYRKTFRIAAFTGLGAGFGFSLGNFFQNLGAISEISYNWWNVMEFTIGFFGGLAMTYAIITSNLPDKLNFSRKGNLLALLFIFIIIPVINFTHGFTSEYFAKMSKLDSIAEQSAFASNQLYYGWIIIIVFSVLAVIMWNKIQNDDSALNYKLIEGLFFLNSLYYIFFLIVRDGMLHHGFALGNSKTLYLPIFIVVFIIYYFSHKKDSTHDLMGMIKPLENWKVALVSLIIMLILFSLISINLHEGLPGSKLRFE